jgi:hypothetical protein
VLTESRRRTCESKEAQEDLACRPVKDGSDTRRGGGRVWSTLLTSGLMVWASKSSKAGLRVWVSKPGRRFQGGTDSTWRHRGVRVEAKLPMREVRWPSDEEYSELDPNADVASWFAPTYLRANGKCVIALNERGAAPKPAHL